MRLDEFSAIVRARTFPDGEATNLVVTHKKQVIDSLIDLQLKVPEYQYNHEDKQPACSVFYNCGATVFNKPVGVINSICTITDTDCCDKVFYLPSAKDEIDCRIAQEEQCGLIKHNGSAAYDYPYIDNSCFEYPTGDTNEVCRATDGIYAIYQTQVWMHPHIQNYETILVNWTGIKRCWQDFDEVGNSCEIELAVSLYLNFMAALQENCDYQRYELHKLEEYNTKVAELIYQTRKENRTQNRQPCLMNA